TIDAGTDQASTDDIINVTLSTATQGLTILVEQNGISYLRSNNTNGEITLKHFHTQVVGSTYDDTIIDNSDGRKTIDGGDGDDLITVVTDADSELRGGEGDDVLTGGDGNDRIVGDATLLYHDA